MRSLGLLFLLSGCQPQQWQGTWTGSAAINDGRMPFTATGTMDVTNGAGIPALYPRVSGQISDYTATQLVMFRDGKRRNSPQMRDIAAKMNDREIRAVSDYMAGLR